MASVWLIRCTDEPPRRLASAAAIRAAQAQDLQDAAGRQGVARRNAKGAAGRPAPPAPTRSHRPVVRAFGTFPDTYSRTVSATIEGWPTRQTQAACSSSGEWQNGAATR